MPHPQSPYSYDAATTYINFKTLNEETQSVDSWFDLKASLENVPPVENLSTTFQQKSASSKANLPQAAVSPLVKPQESHDVKEREMVQPALIPRNVVSSLAAWRVPSNDVSGSSGAPQRVSRRLSAQQKNIQRKCQARVKAEGCVVTPTNKENNPPTKKRKIFNRVPSKTRAPVPRHMARSSSREKSTEVSLNRDCIQNTELSPARSKGKLTMPTTPTMLKRKNLSGKQKSTEEQELEKMKQLQQETVELRRKNEVSLKAAIAGSGQPVKKTTSSVTKPVDFHFCTDERIKQHTEGQSVNEYKELDFAAELRKHPPSPARVGKGYTVPKPFNLSCGNKRKFEETTSEYVPLAQQIKIFQKRTPPRYHLRSRKTDESPIPGKPLKARLTQPKTPLLQTKQRSRPVACKSAAELEAEEIERLQQYKFKAQELNPRIIEGGPILPKKPPAKEPTQPIGFDFEIEKRIQERDSKKQPEEEHFEFHSRPCPAKILEDIVGVPEKKPIPLTIPKSPAFALKKRIQMHTAEEEKEEVVPVIKANRMPHYGVPFKPKAPEHRHVEVCPFSFDSRDRERWIQKDRKIEELQKEEVPKFKALPLPQFDHISLPQKKVKNPTQLEPFRLQTDERGTTKLWNWQQQIKEEQKRQKETACFKANPNSVVYQEPFLPKKDSKPVSVPESFELATEKRAKEREAFEKQLAELEMEKARLQEEARQQEAEREKEELAHLRQELVHRANPVRKYRNLQIKPSDQPLTMPKSPNFSDRFQ